MSPPNRPEPWHYVAALAIAVAFCCLLALVSCIERRAQDRSILATKIIPLPTYTPHAESYTLSPISPIPTIVPDQAMSSQISDATPYPISPPCPPIPRPFTKRGLAVTTGQCPTVTNCDDAHVLHASWAFNWHYRITLPNCPDIETIPMIWGPYVIAHECPALVGNSPWLLTFNEPDTPTQADTPSHDAARAYRTIEDCYPDKLLVSPALVEDFDWLLAMRNEYHRLYNRYPRFDALGLHCYPVRGTLLESCLPALDLFESWCREWAAPELGGCQGIIVNEWGTPTIFSGWEDQMNTLQLRLETDPMILKHAWFTARYSGFEWWAPGGEMNLFPCDGRTLTPCGIRYANFQAHLLYLPAVYAH